jgi:hypothetical protein
MTDFTGGGRRPSLRELMMANQRRMRVDFESRTAQLPTPGEKGLAREDVVRGFLREYLPGRFHVESGFVVDADGRVSRQIDAAIYDHLSAPRFEITEGTRILPVEAVAGVVSIKSFLDSRQLLDAMDNVRSVAELDRTAGGRSFVTFGGVPSDLGGVGVAVAEPVFAAVFAFDGYQLETLASVVHEENQRIDPYQRVQLVCVLSRGVISYLDGPIFEPTYSPTAQVAISEDSDQSLALFYQFLANGVVRKCPLGVSFRKYMELETVAVRCVP